MKYYIHNLSNNTHFVAESFEIMIEWFAARNKPNRHQVQYGVHWWQSRYEDTPIDPKIHHWEHYNSALTHIAMSPNEYYSKWEQEYDRKLRYVEVEKHYREILVKDELGRTIDPRHYWNQIATFKKPKYRYKRNNHPYAYRFDPVPRTSKWKGGPHSSKIRTFQERKLSCDPEIKEYINPSRNMMNLPSNWDQRPRNTNHCWKAKKIEKQWMKHLVRVT